MESDVETRHPARDIGSRMDRAHWPEPVLSSLAASLALFGLLDGEDAVRNGMPLSQLRSGWGRTGMSAESLTATLERGIARGEFEMVLASDGARLRGVGFERRVLDPQDLEQIHALVRAFQEVAACRELTAPARRA